MLGSEQGCRGGAQGRTAGKGSTVEKNTGDYAGRVERGGQMGGEVGKSEQETLAERVEGRER
jgi:hypothetical protein